MKPPSDGDALDPSSRAVGGLGERTLLPEHLRERGHHGVRSVILGPVDDSFAGFQKNKGRSLLSLGMSANPVTMEAFRESKVLCWILLMIRAPLQAPELFFFERLRKDPQQDPRTLRNP